MDNFRSNGVVHRKSLQFPIGNGNCRDRNGDAAYAGEHDQNHRGLQADLVSKSRSNEWDSKSTSCNNNSVGEYSKTPDFRRSVTSNILAPKEFKIQPFFDNRMLRSEILSSARWPNSIEDQERETTRSSSNPAISSSISEDEFARKIVLTTPKHQEDQELNLVVPNLLPAEISPHNTHSTILHPSDSLPHHRDRLLRRKKKLTFEKTESSTDEEFQKQNEKQSFLNSSISYEEMPQSSFHTRHSSKFMTSSMPHMPKHCEVHGRKIRPRDLHLTNHTSSMANVGSWLANQSFEYIDQLQASRHSSPCPHHRSQQFFRRNEEIRFGTPTDRDVTFNVSGQHYIVDTELLARFPDTLLGNEEKRAKYWDSLHKEFFLDRHKATFEVIIAYYVSNGALTRPDDIPIDIFINELKFYCLDRENLRTFLATEGILLEIKEKPMPNTKAKRFIWNLFEDPESCLIARLVTTMSALVIALSVIVFCMETVPAFHSLSKESLNNIKPALHKCEHFLNNMSELYQPDGDLFAQKTAQDLDEWSSTFPDHHDDEISMMSESDVRRQHKKEHDLTRLPKLKRDADKPSFNDFDRDILISTMKRTLSLCASEESMVILYKYTLMRCEIEINDASAIEETPIFHILDEIDLHEKINTSKLNHEDDAVPNNTNITAKNDIKNEDEKTKNGKKSPKRKSRKRKSKKCKNDNGKIDDVSYRNCTKSRKNKKNRSRKRHDNDVINTSPDKNITTTNNTTDEKLVKTENQTKLLTLRQTIRGLNQLCAELDQHSIRSSYGWFVLEASLGGPAGQLFLIESGCIVWFVIEIILRFYSCPNKFKFCTNFLNIIDAVAIMPYFITLIVTSLHTDSNLRPQTATILSDESNAWTTGEGVVVVWTIRLVRMLRILKLSRHSRGLRILGLTLVRSTRVLVLLVCFQMVLAVTFSSIVYYVEYDAEETQFKSIPESFWWAIITMTTVGYGDVVPITTWGRITGTFCAIMGILGIAFPVPVIVSNFNYLYNLDSDACKLTPEELMGDKEEDDNNNNVEKFQENLFDAVRRNVGSMTSAPQESAPSGQNPAELWNYTRRQYHTDNKKTPTKSAEPGKPNKSARGLIAMATASALTVSLPTSMAGSGKSSTTRRQKATSI